GPLGFLAITLEDQWILSRFTHTALHVNDSLREYRFDDAANRIYDFFWRDFCDWYIELIKPRFEPTSGEEDRVRIACRNLISMFEGALRLLHPFMPFITEEIWQTIYGENVPLKSVALAAFPLSGAGDLISPAFTVKAESGVEGFRLGSFDDHPDINKDSLTNMAILQDLIVSVRNLRAELKVEPKVKVRIEVFAHEPEIRAMLERNLTAIERLAGVEKVTFVEASLEKVPGARSTSRFDVHVVYEKKIDVAAECERLKKELEKIEKEIANGQRQLSNEQFLAKAPAKVVEGLKARAEELKVLREKTLAKLKEMGCTYCGKLRLFGTGEGARLHTNCCYTNMDWNSRRITAILENALNEDRATRDATSYACIDPNQRASATIIAKQECILAGLGCVPRILDVYAALDGAVTSHYEVTSHPSIFDGIRVHPGQQIAVIRHNARVILSCERVILNFLQRMAGIATTTRKFVDAVEGTRVRI